MDQPLVLVEVSGMHPVVELVRLALPRAKISSNSGPNAGRRARVGQPEPDDAVSPGADRSAIVRGGLGPVPRRVDRLRAAVDHVVVDRRP